MLRGGYCSSSSISISSILRKAPAKYGRSFLHTETDDNDLTYFVIGQTEVIISAIRELHAYIKRKTAEVRDAESRMRALDLFNHRRRGLSRHALKHPGQRYTFTSHQTSNGIVYQTARTDLLGLSERGVLEKRRRGRAVGFHCPGRLVDKAADAGKRSRGMILMGELRTLDESGPVTAFQRLTRRRLCGVAQRRVMGRQAPANAAPTHPHTAIILRRTRQLGPRNHAPASGGGAPSAPASRRISQRGRHAARTHPHTAHYPAPIPGNLASQPRPASGGGRSVGLGPGVEGTHRGRRGLRATGYDRPRWREKAGPTERPPPKSLRRVMVRALLVSIRVHSWFASPAVPK